MACKDLETIQKYFLARLYIAKQVYLPFQKLWF